MICRQCGAHNEDYLEYCENCAALLVADPPEQEPPVKNSREPRRYVSDDEASSWGFVRGPEWPKPEFDANTITDEDIPPVDEGKAAVSGDAFTPTLKVPPARRAEAYSRSAAWANGANRPQESQVRRAPERTVPERTIDEIEDEFEDEFDDEFDGSPLIERGAAPAQRRYAPPIDNSGAFDYTGRDASARRGRSRKPGARRRGMGRGGAIALIAGVVLLAVIIVLSVIGLNANYGGSLSAFFSSVFSGDPVTREAQVEKSVTKSGDPAHTITVYARNGYTLEFVKGSVTDTSTISGGSRQLKIHDSIWIPDEPVSGETYTVDPSASFTLISPEGERIPLKIPSFDIAVPKLTMTVTEPAGDNVTTQTGQFSITGTVSDVLAEVYVNETAFPVDESGNFTATATVSGQGTHTVVIEARRAGYQVASKTLTVESTAPSTQSDVFKVGDDVALRTTTDTIKVTGTVPAGASITVEGAELESTPVVSSDGAFELIFKTPDIKPYPITVTVKVGSTSSTALLHIERAPSDYKEYGSKAFALDYDRIVQSPNHNQPYKITGEIVEILETVPNRSVVAKIRTSDGKELIFQYYNIRTTKVETDDNKIYDVLCFPYGKHEESGLPMMYAWFILKSDK